MKLIIQLFRALAEFFRWRAVEAEISAKRLRLDEYERVEDEIRKFEKEIHRLRAADNYDAAGLMLKREARRARFAIRLDQIEEGPDLPGSA